MFAIECCKIWKKLLFATDIIYLFIDAHRLMVVDQLAVFDEYSRHEGMAIFCVTMSVMKLKNKTAISLQLDSILEQIHVFCA